MPLHSSGTYMWWTLSFYDPKRSNWWLAQPTQKITISTTSSTITCKLSLGKDSTPITNTCTSKSTFWPMNGVKVMALYYRLTNFGQHDLQEMLRKARQQQHNRKAKQHSTTRPKQSFFKEKLAALGGTQTQNHQLSRWRSYQLTYRGSSTSWAESCIQISVASQPDKQVSSNLVFRRSHDNQTS